MLPRAVGRAFEKPRRSNSSGKAMERLSNVDYHYLAAELQRLRDARVAKITGWADGHLVLRLKTPTEEARVLAVPGERVHETRYAFEAPARPPAFVEALRKRLDNAVFEGAEHVNFDRVVALIFRKKERYRLVVELYGKGNLVLLDEKGAVITRLNRDLEKNRRIGAPPVAAHKDFRTLAPADFDGLTGDAAKAIFGASNLPPRYAREALARADLRPDSKIDELSRSELTRLCSAFQTLLADATPILYVEGDHPVSFAPFPLLSAPAGWMAKRVASLSEAIDELYQHGMASALKSDSPQKPEALIRLEKMLEQQEQAVARDAKEEGEARAVAQGVYANYETLARVVEAANALKKKKAGASEIEATAQQVKGVAKARVKTEGFELEFGA